MRILAICAFMVLTGCATNKAPDDPLMFTRIDGQRITGNLALETQYKADMSACSGEVEKANMTGAGYCRGIDCAIARIERSNSLLEVGKGCMADRGYLLMPSSEGEAFLAAKNARSPKRSAQIPPRQ